MEKVQSLLDEFVKREILREDHGTYSFNLPLFESWLVNSGATKLIPERFVARARGLARRSEDEAFVTATRSPNSPMAGLRTGVSLSVPTVRAWLCQVQSNLDQRILFKLLERLRL